MLDKTSQLSVVQSFKVWALYM